MQSSVRLEGGRQHCLTAPNTPQVLKCGMARTPPAKPSGRPANLAVHPLQKRHGNEAQVNASTLVLIAVRRRCVITLAVSARQQPRVLPVPDQVPLRLSSAAELV